jgi:hypothetical protein
LPRFGEAVFMIHGSYINIENNNNKKYGKSLENQTKMS